MLDNGNRAVDMTRVEWDGRATVGVVQGYDQDTGDLVTFGADWHYCQVFARLVGEGGCTAEVEPWQLLSEPGPAFVALV